MGSSTYITDNGGKLYEHNEYFPFGEVWVDENKHLAKDPVLTAFRFTGKELDVETCLMYFGARYYDPRTSVWQSADPILASYLNGKHNNGVFNSFNLNLYAYAAQNPIKYFDATGEAFYNFGTKEMQTMTYTYLKHSETFREQWRQLGKFEGVGNIPIVVTFRSEKLPKGESLGRTVTDYVKFQEDIYVQELVSFDPKVKEGAHYKTRKISAGTIVQRIIVIVDESQTNLTERADTFAHENKHAQEAAVKGVVKFNEEAEKEKKLYKNHDDRPTEKRAIDAALKIRTETAESQERERKNKR